MQEFYSLGQSLRSPLRGQPSALPASHGEWDTAHLASVLRAAVKMVRAEQGSSAEPAVAKEDSALNKFGRELVSMAAEGKLDNGRIWLLFAHFEWGCTSRAA